MAYIGNSPGVASQRVTTTFTATAGQTTFTPVSGYTLGYCDVFQNGVKLVSGDDYTAADGVSVVLGTGAAAGDAVEVVAHFPRGLSDGYTKAEADARYDAAGAASTAQSAAQTYAAGLVDDLSGVTNASTARTNLGLGNVENKSSATIRGEITSGNVTGALGYTPVNKAGDTMTGALNMTAAGMIRSVLTGTGSSAEPSHEYATPDGSVYFGAYKPGSVVYWDNRTPWETQIQRNGSKHFGIDSSGRVTMPYQPSFHVFTTSSLLNVSTYTVVQTWNTTRHNSGAFNTSNGRFTAPVSGKYLFAYVARSNDGSAQANTLVAVINRNGTRVLYDIWAAQGVTYDGTYRGWLSGSVVLNMSAGDYAELAVGGSLLQADFSGHLLG